MSAVIIVFVVSVAYSVLGNAAVYVVLARRKVPTRFIWSGTPGYLYRVCTESPTVGPGLSRFAFSTNVAFVVAFLAGLGLAGFSHAQS